MEKKPLEVLKEMFGGPTNIARKCKLPNKANVEYWYKVGYIPYCHGTRVMRATGGRIKAIDVWLAAAKARMENETD